MYKERLANNLSSRTTNASDTWLTPKWILEGLTSTHGEFDLDPATPEFQPWPTAKKTYALERGEDGLRDPWEGAVFCNPPYGKLAYDFLKKCAEHNNCVALIFARTDTKRFHSEVFGKADAILFLKGRIKFHLPDGSIADSATAPSCLVAYGEEAVERIEHLREYGFIMYPKRSAN